MQKVFIFIVLVWFVVPAYNPVEAQVKKKKKPIRHLMLSPLSQKKPRLLKNLLQKRLLNLLLKKNHKS